MLEKIQKFREYLDYIERHYQNVQGAWALIQEKCDKAQFRFLSDGKAFALIAQDVKYHDTSKLSAQEFTQYRQYFFPIEGEEKDEQAFQSAWEHHKQHNVHHWQHWTQKYQDDPHADCYLVMMLVDWIAMSFEFGGTAREHYEQHKDQIHLPDRFIDLMYRIFACVYD